MPDCIFCSIVQKQAAASMVYEDKDVMAFMDASPIAVGHVLVVPRQHSSDIFDIDKESLAKTAAVAQVVARAMKKSLGAGGVNLLNASGSVAEQSVPHFHIHVIPRWKDDATSLWDWWHPKVKKITREELDQLAARIQRECPAASPDHQSS